MATIKFKRGTKKTLAEYVNEDKSIGYIPEEGEPVFETDTGRFKIGRKNEDGILMNWNELHYQDEATILSFPRYIDFPKVNRLNVLYKDESTGVLYQGTGGAIYEAISSGGTIENIKIIYGGNANGTT